MTTAIFLVLTAIATAVFPGFSWRIWGAAAVGLLVGVIIGITTDYFTDDTKPIVQKVAHASSFRPGVYGAFRHFLRLYLRFARHGGHRRLRPGGL